jgi:hypothetical protein
MHMHEFVLGEIFLERSFESYSSEDIKGVVTLCFGKPVCLSPNRWYCPYQVVGVDDDKIAAGFGADALEALLTSIAMSKVLLRFYEKHRNMKIKWLNRDDFGLFVLELRKND